MNQIMSSLFSKGNNEKTLSPNDVVFITGCDSGLGHMLAVHCHSLNMTVISACHNIKSEGARILQDLHETSHRMLTIELDLLKEDTLINARKYVEKLLANNTMQYQLMALVNNAGVMCFGEFEWQTWQQIEKQINVNLLGTMRLTKEFIPLLRQQQKHKRFNYTRIINITSHCALQALPKVAPYAASKAALKCWSDALYMELKQYNIMVINFIPGGFITESNIISRQQQQATEMFENFTAEQQRFYKDYFKMFNKYISGISRRNEPNKLQDDKLLQKFEDALTSSQPKLTYIHESWRYKFYRLLFQFCPTCMTSWLVDKFTSLPTYKQALSNL